MGFSKFELQPIESLCTEGGIRVNVGRRGKGGTHCFGPLQSHACKFECSFELIFGNISIISGIIRIDLCKVTCVYSQVPWSRVSTVVFYT